MTETQTPPPACAKCGDTGSIPPFMDPCTCGAMPIKFAPEWPAPSVVEAGAAMDAWDAEHPSFRPTIPGTTIPTPGFPLDPSVGDICWHDGKAYAWDGSTWRWFETEALTYEQWQARYGDAAVTVAVDVEREADDADLFARRAAEMEAEEGIELVEITATWGDIDGGTPASTWSGGATWGAADDEVTAAGTEIDWGKAAAEHWGDPSLAEETDGEYVTTTATIATTVAAATLAEAVTTAAGVKMASAPQGALLARLIAERDPSNILVQAAKSECTTSGMTAKRAGQLIDSLLKLPAVAPKVRPNKYPGTCTKCGGEVAAGTGRIEKHGSDSHWKTFHLTAADCITDAEKAKLDADRVDEPGLFRLYGTTEIYRVRYARGSKRLYGEKVVTSTHTHGDGTTHTDVRFVYNANAMRMLRKSDKLTWAEARAFGKAYGACVACGRTLSDPRSLVQQYGPTCAEHYHWPTVTAKQAEAIIAGTVTWEEVTGTLTVV